MAVYKETFEIGVSVNPLLSAYNDCMDAFNKIRTQIRPKYNKRVKFALDVMADIHAVSAFYDSYGPRFYKRNEDLFNAYKIIADDDTWKIETGPEFMHGGHRIDNEYIFENSFVRGFHGGAIDGEDHPSPGTPYWRQPVGQYYEWGRPATSGPSPEEVITTEAPVILEEMEQRYGDEAMDLLDKYVSKLEDMIYSMI